MPTSLDNFPDMPGTCPEHVRPNMGPYQALKGGQKGIDIFPWFINRVEGSGRFKKLQEAFSRNPALISCHTDLMVSIYDQKYKRLFASSGFVFSV